MQFFRLDAGAIIEGPVGLPRMWTDGNGVQHPITELWEKGHTADVIALGWLPATYSDPIYDADNETVDGETYVVSADSVAVVANIRQLSAEEKSQATSDKRAAMVVSMRQARLALMGAGLLSQIEAAIAGLESPTKEAVLIEWEYAQDVRRTHTWVMALAAQLGITDAQLDDLFATAITL